MAGMDARNTNSNHSLNEPTSKMSKDMYNGT